MFAEDNPQYNAYYVYPSEGLYASSRMRCSIEFWYYLPEAHEQEMILARRTMGKFAGDLSQSGLASSKEFAMWELVLGTSGELSFRTCAGDTLKNTLEKNDDDDDDEIPRPDVASLPSSESSGARCCCCC